MKKQKCSFQKQGMSDCCENPACQKELSDFNKQFYEAPNYEKLLHGYSNMEAVLKYISRVPELLNKYDLNSYDAFVFFENSFKVN
jgi:hypothetical protein